MDSVAELLSRAKHAIASGEKSLRNAAEDIAAAHGQGASQRDIAAAIGKSAAWVNRILAWHRCGFKGGTAFGPAHHKERRVGVHPGKHKTKSSSIDDPAQETKFADEAERSERMAADFEAWTMPRARDAEPSKSIDSATRRMFVEMLGRLSSDQEGEVANAARVIEDRRRNLNLLWDDLIIAAADVAMDKVA